MATPRVTPAAVAGLGVEAACRRLVKRYPEAVRRSSLPFPKAGLQMNSLCCYCWWGVFVSPPPTPWSPRGSGKGLGPRSLPLPALWSWAGSTPPCFLNLYAEYMMWNARLGEAQAGIKTAMRNINNVRYAVDTTLMAERHSRASWWKWKRRVKKLA